MISRQLAELKRQIQQIELKLEAAPEQPCGTVCSTEAELYHYIGKHIATRRKTVAMSQQELAFAIGKSRSAIGNIETGTERITMINLYHVALVLNISAKELLPDAMTDQELLGREEKP